MALLTIEGTYTDGRVELAELPAAVQGSARVIVTFLPAESRGSADVPGSEDRETLRALAFEQMRAGLDLGGAPYPSREELHERR